MRAVGNWAKPNRSALKAFQQGQPMPSGKCGQLSRAAEADLFESQINDRGCVSAPS